MKMLTDRTDGSAVAGALSSASQAGNPVTDQVRTRPAACSVDNHATARASSCSNMRLLMSA